LFHDGAPNPQNSVLITHHLQLDCILDAYDTFARASSTQALKVIINAN
jgi:alcohol dehydrogenase